MSGIPKKFKQVDGVWDKPTEARAWMKSHENPKVDKAADRKAAKDIKDWAKEDAKDARDAKKKQPPKIDLQKAYNKVIEVIGNVFPDGDPIDELGPWFRGQGLDGYEIGEAIEAAMKKHGHGIEKKGMYAYMGSMWEELAKDAMFDAKNAPPGKFYDNVFIEYDDKGKPHLKSNPWK